jgi:proliferating cell nuclear antigen
MYLKSIQASAIRNLFEVLKDIINDVNIYFSKDGMKIMAFDIAHVTLVDVFMAAQNFEEYTCPKDISVGVNISNIFKIIKSIRSNDVITMSVNSENLNISVFNDSKKSKSNFSIHLLDLNDEELEMDKIDLEYVTAVSSVDFQKLVRDMSNIGSEMTIKRESNTITFSCTGDFASQETIVEQMTTVPGSASGIFKLKYLSMFTKGTILCSVVQILQSPIPDSHIVFHYTIANLGDVKFFLAPMSSF